MDCVRNFTFQTNWNTLTTGSPQPITAHIWTNGVQNFMTAIYPYYSTPNTDLSFRPQGWANIDVYGIQVNGYAQGDPSNTAFGGGIIDSWGLTLNLEGQNPTLNGVITQNTLPTPTILQNQNWTTFTLSSLNPKIEFTSPIKSVVNVIPKELKIQAHNLQTATDFDLLAQINVTIYYRFQGE